MREEQVIALRKALWRGWTSSTRNQGWWHQIRTLPQEEFFPVGQLHASAEQIAGEVDTPTYLVAAHLLALASWPLAGRQNPIWGPTIGHALANTAQTKSSGKGRRPLAEQYVYQLVERRPRAEDVLNVVNRAVRHCWRLRQPVHLADSAPLLVDLLNPSDRVRYQAALNIAQDYHAHQPTRRKEAV
ncbi:hypothetical protein [Nocardiopsis metallicus]|uniref:Uncharacterized protein n=1 Tax=Nocardiopsis metallicus TaxID=179819 RepID=A0A840WHX8_9ACTN|nr:hypothetical protein [Nocardiopsis metallicus]MBB5491515.1 hypothetical protein [Nocardiopsis metallicus]